MAKTLVYLALAGSLHGAGYYLPNQDTFATGRGNAFVATADNASAIFYNPAGLVQLTEEEILTGLYSISLNNTLETGGESFSDLPRWQFVPHFYYARPVSEDLVLGIGLNSPFGLGSRFGDDTPFRTIGISGLLEYASLTAAAGYQVNDHLSLGVSLSINRADLALEQGQDPTPGATDRFRFEGDSLAPSIAVSALYQPSEKHSFGAIFSLGTESTLEGHVSGTAPVPTLPGTLDFVTPSRAAIGYSYRPSPGWNIEANIEWLDWDNLNTLTLNSALGPIPVPFEWESSFIYEIGASYRTESGYTFSLGYDYNSSAQPDTFYNPLIADADRHWFNAGISRELEDWSWNFAYQFGYSNRNVTGAVTNLAGQSANGRYESRIHALTLSARFNF